MPVSDIRTLISKLNPTTRKALETAAGSCVTARHYDVEVEHLLIALLEPGTQLWQAFSHFGLNVDLAKLHLQDKVATFKTGNARTPALSPTLVKLLNDAWSCATLKLSATQISSSAILLALIDDDVASELRLRTPELLEIGSRRLLEALPEIINLSTEAATPSAQAAPTAPEATAPPKVFLSYRRSDTETMAQTLYYCLRNEIKGIELFRDGNSLQPGEVFAEVIHKNIANCDALIMLIGKKWLKAKSKDGSLRLSDPTDWVRLEVAEALRQGKKVLPCLIDGARMPARDDLPEELRGLTERHATPIATASFQRDIEPLVGALVRAKG